MGGLGVGIWNSGGGGGASPNFADNETPAGTINGVNTTFTLANTPLTGSLILENNGQGQYLGTAFTLAANTITFNPSYIPQTGDLLRCWYRF